MPVPKRKTSKSRKNKRSANLRISIGSVAACPTCQASVLPHQVCRACGHYKGVKVLKTKTDRMHERAQTRREKSQETSSAEKASE